MSLKKRLVLLILASVIFLAILSHFIFNLTVFRFFEESDLMGSDLENHFRKHLVLFVFFWIASMSAAGILLYLFINRYITRRMSGVAKDIKRIRGFEDLTIRIPDESRIDEVSSLISNFNAMLEKLESENKTRLNFEKALFTNEKLASIGRLASSIAHEINNPILAISNCLQVIKKGCRSNSTAVQEALDISEGEINRIRNIVSGLLDFHRMDPGEFTSVDLKRIIQKAIELLEWGQKLNNLDIEFKSSGNFMVSGSQAKLEQVFINFILNAAEAADSQGGRLLIDITASTEQKTIDIHFYDNGPGIPTNIKDRLFEPFATTKKDQGNGLGLYVSQKIIMSHQGRIFYDEDHTQGAHFIISLPAMEKNRS